MADVKISGLPGATTPVAGSEVLPIVQSGVTKKVSIDNLTAGKAVSASSLTATNLKTSPATANLDISGTTIAASGSDANVDVNINAKGSGVAYLNQRWGVNQSGALVASAGNTYDIGNGTNNPRDVNIDRYAVMNALTASKGVFTDANKNLTTTGTLQSSQGGTGNGFTKFSGPTTSEKTFTLPDANATLARTDAAQTFAAGQIFNNTIGVGGATAANTGSGVTFPATQSASSDANTLDDYEEGTWTPVLQGSSSAGTYTYDTNRTGGQYTKVGNLVTIRGVVSVTGTTSAGSGDAQIINLPFAALKPSPLFTRLPGSLMVQSGPTLANNYVFCYTENSTYLGVGIGSTSSWAAATVAEVATANSIWAFEIQYQV